MNSSRLLLEYHIQYSVRSTLHIKMAPSGCVCLDELFDPGDGAALRAALRVSAAPARQGKAATTSKLGVRRELPVQHWTGRPPEAEIAELLRFERPTGMRCHGP
jgi:hypothetical protein